MIDKTRTDKAGTGDSGTDNIRDESLRKAVESLPRELAPEHDLWPRIARRITPHRRAFQPWSAAAAVTALVAIGAIVGALAVHRQQGPATLANQPSATQTRTVAAAPLPNERTRMLAATIRRSTHQDPHTQAVLLRNLDIVEAAIIHIQQALSENPGDSGLQPLLYQQYRNEATLVADAQRVQLQSATGDIAP